MPSLLHPFPQVISTGENFAHELHTNERPCILNNVEIGAAWWPVLKQSHMLVTKELHGGATDVGRSIVLLKVHSFGGGTATLDQTHGRRQNVTLVSGAVQLARTPQQQRLSVSTERKPNHDALLRLHHVFAVVGLQPLTASAPAPNRGVSPDQEALLVTEHNL